MKFKVEKLIAGIYFQQKKSFLRSGYSLKKKKNKMRIKKAVKIVSAGEISLGFLPIEKNNFERFQGPYLLEKMF